MSNYSPLKGKNVILGVAGGIAAYKSVELLRRLVDSGAYVSPILTESALKFVGKLTFSALASEPAKSTLWEGDDPIPHTHLGQRADVIVVAPGTADIIARYAAGMANDLLTATLIATRAPVVIVAAMHSEMWEHPSVQHNIATLRSRGVVIIDPELGMLAGGDIGVGRLASAEDVVAKLESLFLVHRPLLGKKVLVTAGGTREAIDPVRFIGNRSSGKQGMAFASVAASLGAEVTLITTAPSNGIDCTVVEVESAQEMFDNVDERFADNDLTVMAAAIADFRPRVVSHSKIKKATGAPELLLEPTPDLLAHLGLLKKPFQVLIGFAAETGDPELEAKRKLKDKNADFIVANNVLQPGAGFANDTNVVSVVYDELCVKLELADKREIARTVLEMVIKWAQEKKLWT